MLTAVFGKSYSDIPNHLPASAGISTKQMLAFFLYWLLHIPFTMFRLFQLRWLFTFKMCTDPSFHAWKKLQLLTFIRHGRASMLRIVHLLHGQHSW